MSDTTRQEAVTKVARALFAKANENNLPADKIDALWPSQHHPHWEALANAALDASDFVASARASPPQPGAERKEAEEAFLAAFKEWMGEPTDKFFLEAAVNFALALRAALRNGAKPPESPEDAYHRGRAEGQIDGHIEAKGR